MAAAKRMVAATSAALSRRHHIDAGRRPPGVQPAGAFGEARLIGDIEGVGEELLRVGPVEVGWVDGRSRPLVA